MNDEYPTREELQAILDFEGSPKGFVDMLNDLWWHDGFKKTDAMDDLFRKDIVRLNVSTWGWSGNEDIMAVVRQTWFDMLYWQEHHRGGHYIYEVPANQWEKSLIKGKFGLPHSEVVM